jgi:hypothetical protein
MAEILKLWLIDRRAAIFVTPRLNLCSMPPTPSRATPPSNIAQLGMGWSIATGTIDLGLELFDAIILVGTWIKGYIRKKALEAKTADIIQRGKQKPGIKPRAIQYPQDDTRAHWH